MQESISISHTGLEIVSGKYYAYHDFGQFEITHEQKLKLDWKLRKGSITMSMTDYNAMICEKIIY